MRRRWPVFGLALAALSLIAAVVMVINSVGFVSAKQAQAASVPSEVIRDLTVTTSTVDCPMLVVANGGSTMAVGGQTVVAWRVGALQATPPRMWSDALGVPLSGSTPQQQLSALQAAICEDPLLGATYANMFAGLMVGNVRVGSLNPWLDPFADSGQINDRAASYIVLLDGTNPPKDQLKRAVERNVAWQQVAGKLDTLLGRFVLVGDQSPMSVRNWHLVAGGLVAGGLPEVGLNPNQENLPALVLSVTAKGACAPLALVGANLGDKRPEVFVPPTCTSSAVPPTKPPVSKSTPPPSTPRPTPTPTVPAPKIPGENNLRNPGHPVQINGGGTPSTPSPPVDSSTGCNGSCPGHTATPTPTPPAPMSTAVPPTSAPTPVSTPPPLP